MGIGQAIQNTMRGAVFCAGLAAFWMPAVAVAAILDQFVALPAVPAAEGQVQAALLVRDLRVLQQWHGRRRDQLRSLAIGRTLDDARSRHLIASIWDELARVVEVVADPKAQHGAAPVPAMIAWFNAGDASGFQIAIRVDEGMGARLNETMARNPSSWWRGQATADGFTFDLRGRTWAGRIDAQGWLRIAPDAVWLWQGGDVAPWPLTDAWQKIAADGDVVWLTRDGKGVLRVWPFAGVLKSFAGMLRETGPMAAVWKTDGDRSSSMRFLANMPALGEMAELIRPETVSEPYTQMWGLDAVTHAQFNLQPALMRQMMRIAEVKAESAGVPWSDELTAAAETMDGRVGLLSFDAPSDWAIVLGLRRGENAQRLVTALNQWLQQISAVLHVATPDQFAFTPQLSTQIPGSAAIHIRPYALLEGVRIVAAGSQVLIVSQKERVAPMLHAIGHGSAHKPDMTPMVANTVNAPALCSAYTVWGGETALGDWLTYAASAVRALSQAMLAKESANTPTAPELRSNPKSAWMRDLVDVLPLWVAVSNLRSMLIYDVAFSFDMRGDDIVLQLSSSDL